MVSKNVKRKLGAVKKLTKVILFSYYYKGQNWCTVFVNIPYVIQAGRKPLRFLSSEVPVASDNG